MADDIPHPQILRELRDKNHDRFEGVIEEVEYDHSGMWYSELFIFVLISEYLDCREIIESGRGRGISTDILSRYYDGTEIEITSIDNRPSSKDAQIAEEKLANASNVTLKYGDSTGIVPDLVDDKTAVLIDGPKGDKALLMAIELLEESNVPLVAVHDLHKDHFYRELSELLFTHCMYSDQEELLELFRQYDEPVHRWNKNAHSENSMYGPYEKDGEESHSYGATLGLFLNNSSPVDRRVKENYYDYTNINSVPSLTECVKESLEHKRNSGGPVKRKVANLGLKIGRKVIR